MITLLTSEDLAQLIQSSTPSGKVSVKITPESIIVTHSIIYTPDRVAELLRSTLPNMDSFLLLEDEIRIKTTSPPAPSPPGSPSKSGKNPENVSYA